MDIDSSFNNSTDVKPEAHPEGESAAMEVDNVSSVQSHPTASSFDGGQSQVTNGMNYADERKAQAVPEESRNGRSLLENLPQHDKTALMAVLSILKKHGLKDTENILKREALISDAEASRLMPPDMDVQNVLSSYASEENPDEYTDAYGQLKSFIDSSVDSYKYEIGQVIWPVFVHMYLELVYNEHEVQAAAFFSKFSKAQETFYDADLISLGKIVKKCHLLNSEVPFWPQGFGGSGGNSGSAGLYVVRMSREALSVLKRFLQEKRLKLIQNIIQEKIFIEVYDGIPRGKAAINAVAGHIMGEALRQENKAKVYYGLLREPDLQNVQMDEDEEESNAADPQSQTSSQGSAKTAEKSESSQPSTSQQGSTDKASKKKKSKKDWLSSKKGKNDPHAPPPSRMPLPELRDSDKIEKAKALRESAKRVTLGPERLPSICYYTVLNGDQQVTCIRWSEDGTLMAVGFASASVKIWSLTTNKLKSLKNASELSDIDREADDVLVRMMDDRTAECTRVLYGHSGPVYSVDFSPDKTNLLSASEDTTIRLWSLLTWTCLVVYKGHLFPVWKVIFSPHGGYYFASAGHDRSARLWATDSPNPLRIFAGHFSDVTSIVFHPNSNYVATGSSDRSVRLWDCVSGGCVRIMTGHKATVHALVFSMDGRFLVSSGSDTKIIVWDLANGSLVTVLHQHKDYVYSLTFSREGTLLASGGLDNCVRLWDFNKLTEDVINEEGGATVPPDAKKISGDHSLCGEFYTKNTAVIGLHFTRRNILLASGPFQNT